MAGELQINGVQTHGLLCNEAGAHGGSCKTASSVPRRTRQLQLEKIKAAAAAAGAVVACTTNLKRVRDNVDSSSSCSSSSSSTSSTNESSTLSPPSDPDAETATAAIEVAEPPLLVKGVRCLSHGSVSVIGRRREMEDAVTVAPGFSSAYDFFGVYDGHGGARVAHVCRDRLHLVLSEEAAAVGDVPSGGCGEDREKIRWREAMAASFKRVDGEVSSVGSKADTSEKTVGSTAVVAVVSSRRIVVANCGDSRAVLSRAGVALPLSSDHKPDRQDEMERVEAAGGRVINWDGYRVLGVLATSRSIGDHYLKPYVISEPEVTITDRTEKDEFLILASDGLWDVVSNEVACKVARQCLSGRAAKMFPESVRGHSASEAASLLAKLAISRGSKDNITVVVVELKRLGSRRGS